jgi:hypothetical protein
VTETRSYYDDSDEFDVDGHVSLSRILRELRREERRLAGRRNYGPGYDDDFLDYEDDKEYSDYDDYNEDEFDSYSGIEIGR